MQLNRTKILLWAVLISLSTAAVAAIFEIIGGFRLTSGRFLGTLVLVGLFSLTALGCNIVLDRGVWRWTMVAGLVLSGVALVVTVGMVWVEPPVPSYWGGLVVSSAVTPPITLAVLGLLALTRFERAWERHLRRAGLAIVTLFAVLVYGHFLFDTGYHGKATGVFGVLAGLVVVGLPVAQRLRGVEQDSVAIESARPTISLRCPRCDHEQTLSTGRTACQKCKLRIEIRLEEPRCPHCRYLLYKLTSDRCPECGHIVPG